jgi:hypothetical protein
MFVTVFGLTSHGKFSFQNASEVSARGADAATANLRLIPAGTTGRTNSAFSERQLVLIEDANNFIIPEDWSHGDGWQAAIESVIF